MPTDEEILDWLDPEWRERFRFDADKAAAYYRQYAATEWAAAIKELS